jgi:CHAT domain-containing protein
LTNSTLVYVAPDGELNRLAFEALVDDQSHYLVEHYRFVYLSCGRDLMRPAAKPALGTVVFAGPDFNLNAKQRKDQATALLQKPEQVALRGGATADLRGLRWTSLPGAAAEAADIQKALQDSTYGPVQVYAGSQALEEVLKRMPAPRLLHLATHGFFLEDIQQKPEQLDRMVAMAADARGQERLRLVKNPLLRSGIVLAGANALGEESTVTDVEDGWVTAEEIALLNLAGTDLVVLSACESGLGDLKTGEGVYGLRRAFLYAGSRTLVTSLFKVPDAETRQMMQRFYSGLKAGKGKLEALHEAQLAVIQQRRQEHGAAHPFFWASFVLVGDPGAVPAAVRAPSAQVAASTTTGDETPIPQPGNDWRWFLVGGGGLLLIVGLLALVWMRPRFAAPK